MSEETMKCSKEGCGSKRFKGQHRIDRRQYFAYDEFGNWTEILDEFAGGDQPEEMSWLPMTCLECESETISLDDYHRNAED